MGVVIDAATAQTGENLPIVLAVGINYGQGTGYLSSGVPTFAPTGLHPKLKKVYQSLTSKLVLEKKETEITALFSALAAATVLLSATLSLLWFNRVL